MEEVGRFTRSKAELHEYRIVRPTPKGLISWLGVSVTFPHLKIKTN